MGPGLPDRSTLWVLVSGQASVPVLVLVSVPVSEEVSVLVLEQASETVSGAVLAQELAMALVPSLGLSTVSATVTQRVPVKVVPMAAVLDRPLGPS